MAGIGGLPVVDVKREQRTVSVGDGEATGERLLSVLVGNGYVQGRFVQCLTRRARIQSDFADFNVVAGVGRRDGNRVFTVMQRAGRQWERLNQVLLGEKQFAQFAAVQLDAPIELYVALTDEQRVLVCVGLGRELEVQSPAMRCPAGKLLPSRIARCAEVVEFVIQNAQ